MTRASVRYTPQARARLLLLGARMESAQIAVVCDASAAWLVWVDGGKTRVEEGSGIVEGALDAIETRRTELVDAMEPLGVYAALDVPDRWGPTWSQRR